MRQLRHAPGFVLTAVLTLGAAIGAVVAVFSVYSRVVLHPVTVAGPEELVSLYAVNPNVAFVPPTLSWPKFLAIRDAATVFSSLGAYGVESVNLGGHDGGPPEQLRALRVSDGFFDTLGLRAAQGRLFTAADDLPNGPDVCVLSHELWQTRFGGRAIAGQMIQLNGVSTEVIGVLPPRMSPPWSERQIFLPRVFEDSGIAPQSVQNGATFLDVVARLRRGATTDAAVAELAAVTAAYASRFGGRADALNETRVRSLAETVTGDRRAALETLLGAVGAVLLIACANVAALFLGRLVSRQREIAVRQALGASRAAIVRQLLGESLMLAGAAGALGVALAFVMLQLGQTFLRAELAGAQLGFDWPALGCALAATLVCAGLVGLVPAVQVTRAAAVSTIAGSDRGMSGTAATRRLRSWMVIAETAVSVALLVGAALLLVSLARLQRTSPGFAASGVAAAFTNLTPARYATPEQRARFFLDVLERLQAAPQVSSAAVVFGLPFHDENYAHTYAVRGRPVPAVADRPRAGLRMVTEDYFAVMGIRLIEGRAFAASDRAGSPPVCVVNASLARRLFGAGPAVGQVILRGLKADQAYEIVGVIADVKTNGLRSDTPDEIFYPFRQQPRANAAIVARGEGDPRTLAAAFRSAAAAVDPDQPLSRFASMEERLAGTMRIERTMTAVTAAFAVIALVLAATGLYAVLAHAVAARRVEIGVRMAVGAERAHIVRMVVSQGMSMVAAGIAAGLLAAVVGAGLLSSQLYGIEARNPFVFAAVAAAFAAVSALACAVPALRASRLDPLIALRAR